MKKISTPGRICLFGEHQDYLKLPVIAAAINRRVAVSFSSRPDQQIAISLPDIGEKDGFHLDDASTYRKDRDYFKSCIVVLRRAGFEIDKGMDCMVRGNIPINSGTSSSSALVVSWIGALLSVNGYTMEAKRIAELAVEAEVLEFGEAGGIMDQYSTALGDMIYLDTQSSHFQYLPAIEGTFVLGDSQLPKATLEILLKNKNRILGAVDKVLKVDPGFDLKTSPFDPAWGLDEDSMLVMRGTLRNRDITQEAKAMLGNAFDGDLFGRLLTEEHAILDQVYGLSPDKINTMLSEAIRAGAKGGKINGSGGGGCMFAYAPEDPEKVAAAIEAVGGKAHIITIDKGTKNENE